jgi:hypothetical protein
MRETLHTPVPGVYLSEGKQWQEIAAASTKAMEPALKHWGKTSDERILETKNVMPKKKSHPVAKQFSNEAMKKIKRYGQALSGGVAPFDEEVERHLARYEADRKKMEAAAGATH